MMALRTKDGGRPPVAMSDGYYRLAAPHHDSEARKKPFNQVRVHASDYATLILLWRAGFSIRVRGEVGTNGKINPPGLVVAGHIELVEINR